MQIDLLAQSVALFCPYRRQQAVLFSAVRLLLLCANNGYKLLACYRDLDIMLP